MVRKLATSDRIEPEEIVAALKRLGFTEYESRIYIRLIRQDGPVTAYEVSKRAGVPRPNTYNALESLARRGAVLPVSEGPTRYVAAEPKEFLARVARQTSTLCEDMADWLTELAPEGADSYVWTLSGEVAVHDKIEALIAGARENLMVKAPDDILRRHRQALATAGERGIEMLIVVFGATVEEFTFGPNCRTFLHEANGVRMGSTDNLFTIAADHREMVTARLVDEVIAEHTRNGLIVNMAESLIRHDYYMAEIFARFGDEITGAFGPHLRDLRLGCFTEEQAESFKAKTALG